MNQVEVTFSGLHNPVLDISRVSCWVQIFYSCICADKDMWN